MRILIAIPHYFGGRADRGLPGDGRRHGSTSGEPGPRVAALAACIRALHQLYGQAQYVLDHSTGIARPGNPHPAARVQIIVCTTGGDHLLAELPLPTSSYHHHPTSCEPLMLGFECQSVLAGAGGLYDYYGYLEDDLIARDPWMFLKMAWFNEQVGNDALLQPNRYEIGELGLVHKVYIDEDLPLSTTSAYQNLEVAPVLTGQVLGRAVDFLRPSNPHSGCYFLNDRQLSAWVASPSFLDGDTGFISPLESAATLSIMRNFRVYKPAPYNLSFLEIQHHGTAYLGMLRRRRDLSS